MKITLLLLALCHSLSLNRVYSQTSQGTGYQAVPEVCCNSQCGPRVQVTSDSILDVINISPNYEIIATEGFYNQGLDNICITFFQLDDDTYLRVTSLTFSNGTVVIQKHIAAVLTGYQGVARLQGLSFDSGSSTLVFDEAILGNPCPGVYAYYRKYLAGSCNVLQDQLQYGDSRHGDANTRTISDYCLNQIVSIANSQDFNGSNFVKYPYKLNSNCVTQVNGMTCINANKVRRQDSISIPGTGTSRVTVFN